jgi:hypothetical protein
VLILKLQILKLRILGLQILKLRILGLQILKLQIISFFNIDMGNFPATNNLPTPLNTPITIANPPSGGIKVTLLNPNPNGTTTATPAKNPDGTVTSVATSVHPTGNVSTTMTTYDPITGNIIDSQTISSAVYTPSTNVLDSIIDNPNLWKFILLFVFVVFVAVSGYYLFRTSNVVKGGMNYLNGDELGGDYSMESLY